MRSRLWMAWNPLLDRLRTCDNKHTLALWMAWNPLLDRLELIQRPIYGALWMAWNPLLDRLGGVIEDAATGALDGLESAS